MHLVIAAKDHRGFEVGNDEEDQQGVQSGIITNLIALLANNMPQLPMRVRDRKELSMASEICNYN